ncbi:MAG: cytochrome c biogenesis protein CcdA [Clostridia bacterium]
MEVFNNFSILISQNIFLGIIISLIAGIISSFSPCTLTTLPLIIGYISTDTDKSSNKKIALKYSLLFSLGIIITFVTIGVLSALLGKNLKIFGNWWYVILSIILIYVFLQLFDVFPSVKSCKRPKFKKKLFGAFILGIFGGFFASPCSTPVLIAIISFIANGANIFLGVIYMLVYSIGFCTLLILASISLESINKLAVSDKYMKLGKLLRYILGIFSLIMALILLYNIF